MLSRVMTAGLSGIDAFLVNVETDISPGLPMFTVVGLPSVTVREAKERVRAAINNRGYIFPDGRITVNLSPAGSRKEGSYFDLPMALGLLATDVINEIDSQMLSEYGIMGELGLNGEIRHIDGALPLVIGLRASGFTKVMLPKENLAEVIAVDGVELYPIDNLDDAVNHFNHFDELKAVMPQRGQNEFKPVYEHDFYEVKGQEVVKRALVISVAGGHAIYLHGFPGSGKSMLAKRIPTIMPELSYEEMLEITMLYSVAGKLNAEQPMIQGRPFRAPHHSITRAALMGGEKPPKPGEVSLAHRGVLFLDEFPEFSRETLETLRQPVEDGKIVIQRADTSITFPCEFILVAAGNPCRCGYYGSSYRRCKCSMNSVHRYQSKLSGPLIDRIDMQITVAEIPAGKLIEGGMGEEHCACSAEMRADVQRAREVQLARYGSATKLNAHLDGQEIETFCPMTEEATRLLAGAADTFALSMRSCTKIIKVARTIADLDGSRLLEAAHIAEALQYRAMDKMYAQ